MKFLKFTILLFILPNLIFGQDKILKKCYQNQANLKNKKFEFKYTEKQYSFRHASYPWQKAEDFLSGKFFLNNSSITTIDSVDKKMRKTFIDEKIYASTKFGLNELQKLTISDYYNRKFKTLQFSPLFLLEDLYSKKVKSSSENSTHKIYNTEINKGKVEVFINKKTNLTDKIRKTYYDEFYGDLETTILYNNYKKIDGKYFATKVNIEKINGKLVDEVEISDIKSVSKIENSFVIPTDYKLIEDSEIKPEILYNRFSDNIHLLELKHTDDKVLIAEFEDYLIVAEAPMNSKNGELIISKAKELFPNKPIKYFAFGHYHPHYIGGIRAFINNGTKIICSDINKEYATYLSNTKHSLNPDKQEINKKEIQIELIKDKLVYNDDKNELQIYFIGEKSEHSNDYLIYYFPREKVLFQDDLVWIKSDKDIEKASKRQAGLYQAIVDLKLDVKTILQSWPVKDYGVKTVIPFSDLEKSMNVK